MQTHAEKNIQHSNKFVKQKRGRRGLSSLVRAADDNTNHIYADIYCDAPRKKSKKYRRQHAYVIAITDEKANPQNYIVVKSLKTLEKVVQAHEYVLLYPYPVSVPTGFWQEYRKAKTGKERVELVKKYELIKEKSIFVLDKLILDIDSNYDENLHLIEKFFVETGLSGIVSKTKSGNARIIINFAASAFDMWNRPHTQSRNKKTHLQNTKEMIEIANKFFEIHGMIADNSFKYINHPIWIRYNEYVFSNSEQTAFNEHIQTTMYKTYNSLKKLQKQYGLYPQQIQKKARKHKVELPAFLRNRINAEMSDAFEYWSRAVESLSRKVSSHTFTHLILPAIGWAKWLGLDEREATAYLQSLLAGRDGKKTEKDIRTAWKVARELEFHLPERTLPANMDYATLSEQALNYIRRKGTVKRQELLKEVFFGQVWLLEKVLAWLEQNGYIRSAYEKQGRGRPAKIYEPLISLDDFSQYNNSLSESSIYGLVVDGNVYSPKGDREEIREKGKEIKEQKEKKEKEQKEKEKGKEREKQTKENTNQTNINGGQAVVSCEGQVGCQELPGQVGQDFSHNNNPDPDKELLDRLQELIQQKRKLWQERQEQVNRSDKEQAVGCQELLNLSYPPGCQELPGQVGCQELLNPPGCQADDGWTDDVLDIISDYL